jgi:hypothetical protein
MTQDEALSIADKVLALINGQPRTPSREEIAELLMCARPDRQGTFNPTAGFHLAELERNGLYARLAAKGEPKSKEAQGAEWADALLQLQMHGSVFLRRSADGTSRMVQPEEYLQMAKMRGERVYMDDQGRPYRYDGSIFMDPQGLKVIAPPEVREKAERDCGTGAAEALNKGLAMLADAEELQSAPVFGRCDDSELAQYAIPPTHLVKWRVAAAALIARPDRARRPLPRRGGQRPRLERPLHRATRSA